MISRGVEVNLFDQIWLLVTAKSGSNIFLGIKGFEPHL